MQPEDRIRLAHMIDAAEAVGQFMVGRDRADLDSDRMLLFAVVRAIEILGEAAARMSEDVRRATPDIPWNAIVGMRNRLIHGYFNIDVGIVWKTVSVEIPALLPKLRTISS